jgi:hypothetical protein
MCLRFQFCTHQRVCVLTVIFFKKVKFVVPYLVGLLERSVQLAGGAVAKDAGGQ